MKVAIYHHHHDLPFWCSPENPKWIFDPKILTDWFYESRKISDDGVTVGYHRVPATKHYMMPVLNGLNNLEIPGIMAHVSMHFDHELKMIKPIKKIWVQITTEATETNEYGLPIVVKDGVVQVQHLWGGDNGTRNPYHFLKERDQEEDTSEFWTNFFLTKLRKAKRNAFKTAKKERAEARRLDRIHSSIPS